ncbi:TonB-dependent receptor [Colwellia sp. MB02u-18]|uniref:TonB-dependent receptor n=1 Tax=unclassified Colwellia TaxID=196834 RepID=UPI0015F44F5B|nr:MULTISPECIES: TonB-dependent receptor [unclassified Colwellia]MBA6223875.1 TonB-dependent receptor [Colwellia sp. MB3u-45]MBA6267418.1 TonB-dependent receptor [Colwellia sp. MB3u-43]MBA6320056.1 TonB-dependent receptor [Colwellia sp. MB02u-19]MBA6324874.1 TonB-dependent receptor [Colwellia sp. MB02u-18]MBA6330555.1 TonB-dependent receptor [Colwellia sp. MB02u-12]
MYNNSKVAKAVRIAMMFSAGAAAAISAPAFAAEDESAESVERIEVTGSRIKRADMEGANPVQVITRQDLVASGISNMGDILQEIPSVAGAGTNTAINNGGSGAIRVSLRGLGSERTLVLLNGRRMVASGTGADSSVDLSTIPTAIVKRVEVLKDGASAIYGSDAIGGVVNIITRDDFEGFEFNAGYDIGTEESDGETKNIDLTIGFSGDKGNAVVNAYYVQQGAQWSGDRDWSKFDYGMEDDGSLTPGGSSATPWGRFRGFDEDADGCTDFTHGAANGPGQSDPSDHRTAGYDCFGGTDLYNFAPANYHLTPAERYGVFASGSYELNDSVRVFTELSFNRRTSDIKLAPLPLAPLAFFGYSAPYTADNYYNQTVGPKNGAGESQDIADWRRRMVETGGRDSTYRIETVRAMFGIDGEFDNGWGWEASYIFGSNDSATSAQGGVNFEKVALAVGPSFLDDTGSVICGTVDAPIAGCVSLNVFGVPGTDSEVSQEMLDYITFEAHDLGSNEQQIMSASIFGDAFELPAGTVGFAAGIEHREEKGADYPDALIALGITSGSSRTSTEGSYEVDEVFLETNVPLLNGVVGAEILEVDLAVRYSDYNTFGDTTNHKIGVRWVPFDGLMVRGTSSTAFRAPSTSDLFAGSSDNSPEVVDPCFTNPTAFCIANGVPAAGFVPIGDQLSSTRGGNQDLQPEEADIFTAGVVYSPDFAEDLSLTLDYWDIKITSAISTLGEQLILTSCAKSGEYCDKITRFGVDSPLYGNSIDIDDRTTNVGGVDSSGYDFNVRYSTDLEGGTITFNVDTTYYDTYDITQANGAVIENAGYFYRNSGDGNFPKWKTNADVRYTSDDWSAAWSVRYIGDVKETFGEGFRTIDKQIINDARFSYFMDNMTASIGLNNIFDEDPPYADTGFNDNTDPRTYNTSGRHVYVTLGLAF